MIVGFALMAISQQTFLEWADAIGVPIIVVVIAGIFVIAAQKSGDRAQTERENQLYRAREATLRAYLDRVSDLVLEKGLANSDVDSPERAIALARTHNALTILDGPRKGLLIKFLKDSQLIRNGQTVISLRLADLTNSNLGGIDLRGCDFSGANLRDAYLYDSDFRGSNLENCVLTNADLRFGNFEGCVLTNRQISQCAELVGATLPNGELATEQTLQQLLEDELE